MLFLCSERDVFANFGKHLRGYAEERGEVLQGKMLNNTGTTLQQQLTRIMGTGRLIRQPSLVSDEKKNNENFDIFAEKLGENLKKVYICTDKNLKNVQATSL